MQVHDFELLLDHMNLYTKWSNGNQTRGQHNTKIIDTDDRKKMWRGTILMKLFSFN